MARTTGGLLTVALISVCLALAVAVSSPSSVNAADAIKVWKVGSPHRGDTPHTRVPSALQHAAASRGLQIVVEAFPARGFESRLVDAVRRNTAPDVLVFDNMGVLEGITTALGRFGGIGQVPTIRRDLIHVTGAFDGLLGTARGWTYLFSASPNHAAAKALALRIPECANGSGGPSAPGELADLVPQLASAYLEGDTTTIQTHSDSDRLFTIPSKPQIATVKTLQPCGSWGNSRLSFASLNASYEADTALGHRPVLIGLRKRFAQWQLLTAARDPVTNAPFVKELPSATARLTGIGQTHALPVPATLLSPPTGQMPRAPGGHRFGSFRWRSSPSTDVVFEIVEFSYQDDARLFVSPTAPPGSERQISAGRLWTTGGEWQWRVWSVNGAGEVGFSDVRTFRH